jgi:hypothetical protein
LGRGVRGEVCIFRKSNSTERKILSLYIRVDYFFSLHPPTTHKPHFSSVNSPPSFVFFSHMGLWGALRTIFSFFGMILFGRDKDDVPQIYHNDTASVPLVDPRTGYSENPFVIFFRMFSHYPKFTFFLVSISLIFLLVIAKTVWGLIPKTKGQCICCSICTGIFIVLYILVSCGFIASLFV